ncbi:MAG: hypothetical protein JSS31_02705 [Proteobacteria bacterium]|nr:hypothetical protein [Pseudomonadota bacterium]MBS0492859.1 hypothetical protein [Pseudomonadota bacterium]
MRAVHSLLLLALISAPALAQTTSPNTAPTAPGVRDDVLNQGKPSRVDQRIEHIRIEDGGSRIDEVRVGGQTQSITVQPKTGTPMPSYEVQSNDGARAPRGNNDSGTVNAPRVWNLRKF